MAQLLLILVQAHRGQRRPYVNHGFRRSDARADASAHLVEHDGDCIVPTTVEAQRGIQRRTIGRQVRELCRKIADRIGLVETEDFAGRVRPVAEAVPYLALGVLVAAEQDLLRIPLVGTGEQHHDGLRLRKTGHVIEVAFGAIGIVRIRIANRFRRGGNRGNAAARLAAHFGDQLRAPRAVMLMVVVHRWSTVGRG